ncbi:hypothetical protein MMC21_005435 [Puttea exsequens]|nr:hypothetical protein [Puttea exsequens]
MKSFITILALAGSLSPFALGAPSSKNILSKRLGPTDEPGAIARMETLFTDVQQYTGAINSTAASLGPDSTAADNTTAGETFTSAIASINTLVVDATSDVNSGSLPVPLAKRQAAPPTGGLPAELALIIEEIGGALNQIIATLGLTATLSFLGPLVGSLSLLLAALIPVVDNLLAVVAALLDGILGGLSLALAGLVL